MTSRAGGLLPPNAKGLTFFLIASARLRRFPECDPAHIRSIAFGHASSAAEGRPVQGPFLGLVGRLKNVRVNALPDDCRDWNVACARA